MVNHSYHFHDVQKDYCWELVESMCMQRLDYRHRVMNDFTVQGRVTLCSKHELIFEEMMI